MGLAHQSKANHQVTFSNAPAETAERLIAILGDIGKVQSISKESGSIQAVIKKGVSFVTRPHAQLQISKSEQGTDVKIEITCDESVAMNYHRAEKAMATLLDSIGEDEVLQSSSNSGW